MRNKSGICIVSFSNNSDHQEYIYSLYYVLKEKINTWTIGIKNPKALNACNEEHNLYVDCPERPGLQGDTFRFDRVLKIASQIRKMNVRFVYFESIHVWNILLMVLLRKSHICIEGVHDVVPHDGNKKVAMATNAVCKLSHYVLIHNKKYIDEVQKLYGVPQSRIIVIGLWKEFPPEIKPSYSGIFMNFGRIRKYKGLDLMEVIIKRTPSMKYMIAGSPDRECKPVVDKIKKYENVNVIDREISVEEMGSLFAEVDWVVLPYATATQSGVIIDAYRYSRPVICFDVGALSEQVKDGVSGKLVEPKNAEFFVQAILDAANLSLDEYSEYAHNAYQFGKALYSAETAGEKFLSAMNRIDRSDM